jgi:hypothetical protein
MVRPLSRAMAQRLCADHPHAQTLPKSGRYYLGGFLDDKLCGLAVWGYGVNPTKTPKHLFGEATQRNQYLELCRFFVYDWAPKNTASAFLAATHRIIKRHRPDIKWLFTYAAGFQGMVGTIYQAANYEYIGRQPVEAFVYIPQVGLVHAVSIWHRFKQKWCWGTNLLMLRKLEQLWGLRVYFWRGVNYRYIYWLCDANERQELLAHAKFKIEPYPRLDDVKVWLVDADGVQTIVPPSDHKSVPIIRLSSTRTRPKDSSEPPAIHAGEGGAAPTRALQNLFPLRDRMARLDTG